MRHRISPLAAAFAVILAGVAASVVWLTLWSRGLQEETREAHGTLRRIQATAALARPPASFNVDRVRDSVRGDFLEGDQDAIVLANLQTRLRSLFEARACSLMSASTLPNSESLTTATLGLKVQVRGPFRGMHQALQDLEQGSPLLVIDRAELRLDETATANGNSEPTLFADIDVVGFRLPAADVKQGEVPAARGGAP